MISAELQNIIASSSSRLLLAGCCGNGCTKERAAAAVTFASVPLTHKEIPPGKTPRSSPRMRFGEKADRSRYDGYSSMSSTAMLVRSTIATVHRPVTHPPASPGFRTSVFP